MFRTKKLDKVMIIGPKNDLPLVSRTLHDLNMLHIDSFTENAGGMSIGEPMESAQELSGLLLRVRRLITILGVNEFNFPPSKKSVRDIKGFISGELAEVEKEYESIMASTSMSAGQFKEAKALAKFLRTIANLPKSERPDGRGLEVIAGYCSSDVAGTVKKISPLCQIHYDIRTDNGKSHMFYLIYYPEKVEKMLGDILELAGFENLDIPLSKGPIEEWVKSLDQKLAATNSKKMLAEMSERCGEMLLASAEYLGGEVEKAELPLRCATTDSFFILEGWVRIRDTDKLKNAVESATVKRVTVQKVELDEISDENTPALLEHNSVVNQFHYLVGLHSSPNFNEIDPTLIMALIFPVFFGLMIGDIGYGIVLMVLGYILTKKRIFGIGGDALGNIIIIGGFASILFGAFLFGDMFGIPFHPNPLETDPTIQNINWLHITGFDYPLSGGVHKLDPTNVMMLIILSVVAGFMHMTLALLFGLSNSISQKDRKYAVSRMGWLLLLFAVFVLAMNQAQGTEFGQWFTTNFMFSIQEPAMLLKGIPIPYATILSGAVGMVLVVLMEGPFAVIESMGMVTNLISYSRLAAVGVAKAGLALSLNIIFITMIMPIGPVFVVLGILGLAVSQFFIVILLGALSAGIQALRLHYVEFFMKFYRGDGKVFKPFGPVNRYCQCAEAAT
ncbi:MAG: V-type ATPase 116kDa subunit family protein [Thermoplasmata archaeon]